MIDMRNYKYVCIICIHSTTTFTCLSFYIGMINVITSGWYLIYIPFLYFVLHNTKHVFSLLISDLMCFLKSYIIKFKRGVHLLN